ncbi:hypothetical protein BHF71_08850 [Vulcanibacillus modesticaldus]|uniref:TadE-like domain-containing protein n=1 Tax=Vulcanibacillus modesticaldus TaxID=337097 RepID=A0A1D2YV05_9BACI|nr:TadE/TadG family type IV pilus assembly protein [Vulcanibacillus modesticaldus]OEF99517.1 hypothetical protein BHF71_08850 [Vulcanibacillus modesticaldus]
MKWLRGKEEGQSLVEFSLVFPILLILLLGIIEFGQIFYSYLTIQNASRDGARYGSVWVTDTEIETIVLQKTKSLDQTSLTVTISPAPNLRTSGGQIKVTIDYSLTIIAPIWRDILPNPFPISAETVMRLE